MDVLLQNIKMILFITDNNEVKQKEIRSKYNIDKYKLIESWLY